jgi:hypothetical protein
VRIFCAQWVFVLGCCSWVCRHQLSIIYNIPNYTKMPSNGSKTKDGSQSPATMTESTPSVVVVAKGHADAPAGGGGGAELKQRTAAEVRLLFAKLCFS